MNADVAQGASPKRLGFWMLTALVMGNMIGSGIFSLPPALAPFGRISLAAWLFTAAGSLILALVFAKLGRIFPRIGGPYAYCREAFGDFIGFQVAYNYWIALWIGNAGIAIAFVGYLAVFFPALGHNPLFSFGTAVSAIWFLTWVNIMGVREAGILQLLMTILKVLPLILFGTIGFFYVDSHNILANNMSGQSDFSAFAAAAALTLWAFIGLESATVPASEIENPNKTIPRATIIGVILTAIIYISSTVAVTGILPLNALLHSTAPFADAAEKAFGVWGRWFIAAGAVISTFGTLNGWTLLQARIPFAAARDGIFPRIFAKQSKNATPVVGALVSASLITTVLLFTLNDTLMHQFQFFILLAVLATLIPYLLTSMGLIIFYLEKRSHFVRTTKWGILSLGVAAFLYSFWALIGAGKETVYYGILLFFTGVPVYVWHLWCSKKGD